MRRRKSCVSTLKAGWWVKLEILDSHGTLSYTLPDGERVELPKGAKTLRVRWPNGRESREEIETECYINRGRTEWLGEDREPSESIIGYLQTLKTSHHGISMLVRLHRFREVFLPRGTTIDAGPYA